MKNSPAWISSSIASTAMKSPYLLVRPVSRTSGDAPDEAPSDSFSRPDVVGRDVVNPLVAPMKWEVFAIVT